MLYWDVCEGVFSVCELLIMELNACCLPECLPVCMRSDSGAFLCVIFSHEYARETFCLSACVCVCELFRLRVCLCATCSVCVCPWCAASKAWRVALTGLSSISGSALGLKLGGRREEARWRDTGTHTHTFYST